MKYCELDTYAMVKVWQELVRVKEDIMDMNISKWNKYENINGLPSRISAEVINDDEPEKVLCPSFDIEKLEKYYFIADEENAITESDAKDNPIKPNFRTYSEIEKEIERIIEKDKWEPIDVLRILAWKTGKIKHEESKDKTKQCGRLKFQYSSGWPDDDESVDSDKMTIQLPQSSKMEAKDFIKLANKVISLRKDYVNRAKSIEKIWEELVDFAVDKNNKMHGLGTVYLITLLSFISKGEKPIFDRFAMASLTALKLKKYKKEVYRLSVIRGCSLPKKTEINRVKRILGEETEYGKYCSLLEEFFPNGEWKERRVDRALWVYGHYFKVPKED